MSQIIGDAIVAGGLIVSSDPAARPSLREELKSIQEQTAALEAREKEIYRASVEAPEAEKVCEDFMAKMLGEPMPYDGVAPQPRLVQAMTVTGDVVGSSWLRLANKKSGAWVAIRPCDDACKGRTYLGVYLGDIALGLTARYDPKSGVLELRHGFHNPAIWVPDLKRIVFGAESWWGILNGPEDLRKITDADIDNIWYVQALKALGSSTG